MKSFLKALGLSTLGAALFYSFVTVAPIVRAGVSCSVPFVFSNGTTADATQVNANFNSLVNCFATTASAGANNDITSLSGLTTPLTPSQGGASYYIGGTATGGTNAYAVATAVPNGFSLVGGYKASFIPNGPNTGISTLNFLSTGAITILRPATQGVGLSGYANLVGGEIIASVRTEVMYDSVNNVWVLMNSMNPGLVGQIVDFGFAGCPTGWAETNGANNVYSTASYPQINTLYGTTWGTNGGFTVMPDLRGRTTFSRDGTGTRLTTDQNGALAGNTVGTTGGVQNQTLTEAQLPVVSHTTTGSATPTVTANYTPGSVAINQNVLEQNTITGFVGGNQFGPTGSGVVIPEATGGAWALGAPTTPIPSYSPTLNAISGSSWTFSFGSGNSHPVTPPLGIVTKCVKL